VQQRTVRQRIVGPGQLGSPAELRHSLTARPAAALRRPCKAARGNAKPSRRSATTACSSLNWRPAVSVAPASSKASISSGHHKFVRPCRLACLNRAASGVSPFPRPTMGPRAAITEAGSPRAGAFYRLGHPDHHLDLGGKLSFRGHGFSCRQVLSGHGPLAPCGEHAGDGTVCFCLGPGGFLVAIQRQDEMGMHERLVPVPCLEQQLGQAQVGDRQEQGRAVPCQVQRPRFRARNPQYARCCRGGATVRSG
jgi:hypothetical protein